MGHRSSAGAVLAALAALAVAAPAIASTHTTTTATVDRGHGFALINAAVTAGGGDYGSSYVSSGMVRFTIRNATTHARLRTFELAAGGRSCSIATTTSGRRMTLKAVAANGAQPCAIRPYTGPRRDRYTVTAAFLGNGSDGPSSSTPETL